MLAIRRYPPGGIHYTDTLVYYGYPTTSWYPCFKHSANQFQIVEKLNASKSITGNASTTTSLSPDVEAQRSVHTVQKYIEASKHIV